MERLLCRHLEALVQLEEEAAREYLAAQLQELGFAVERQPVGFRLENLVAWRGEPEWFVEAHVDTYLRGPMPVRGWAEGAFSGRGALDVRGQIAALLVALRESTTPVELAFVCDEEEGGRGSAALRLRAKKGIVLEPTEFCLGVAQVGGLEAQVIVEDRPVHAGASAEARRLAERVERFLEELTALLARALRVPAAPPPYTSFEILHVGWQRWGEDPMVTPWWGALALDVRVPPGNDWERAAEVLEGICRRHGFRLVLGEADPPTGLPEDATVLEEFSQKLRPLGVFPRCWYTAWTDAGNLWRDGKEAVIWGAGPLWRAHGTQERVRLAELLHLAEGLRRLLS